MSNMRFNGRAAVWLACSVAVTFSYGRATAYGQATYSVVAPRPAGSDGTVILLGDDVVEVAAPANSAAAASSSGGKPKTRLERLQQLTFDRGPAAVLKAWNAENNPKPKDAAKPPTASSQGATSPAASSPRLAVAPNAISAPIAANAPKSAGAPSSSNAPAAETKKSGVTGAAALVAGAAAHSAAVSAIAAKPDPLDAEMAAFQAHVTLGRWPEVKRYLAGLTEAERNAAWKQLLASLSSPQRQYGMPNLPREAVTWTIDDLLGLASARPKDLDKESVAALGRILASALERDFAVETVVVRLEETLKKSAEKSAEKSPFTRRQAAQLLQAAGRPAETARFLPTLDEAVAAADSEGLNLLALHFAALRSRDGNTADLERSWNAARGTLALEKAPPEHKDQALKHLVGLAPRMRPQLGRLWFDESFTRSPERGAEILTLLGQAAATALERHPHGPDERAKTLEFQKIAVEALLKANPKLAARWKPTLQLLAANWLREAEYSQVHDHSAGSTNRMQSDQFGNVYYQNMEMMMHSGGDRNQPHPIPCDKLLEHVPDGGWATLVDRGVQVPILVLRTRLLLKVNREEQAFPLIETLAPEFPERARLLAEEFLRVWKQNHDPNESQQRYMNPFYFYYGFNDRAQSIPLTRSKQERNLVELAGWVARLQKLSLAGLDDDLLAQAFTTCHSSAEVYRLEAMARVFGPIEKMKPQTLAALSQQMRRNLAGLWRAPKVQEAAKTKRKTKDVEAEVLRGYGTARDVVKLALAKYPEEWSLHLAAAALELDESNFRQELEKDPKFQERRSRAMAGFARAAELYAAAAPKLSEAEESISALEQWFHASLGACDLESIDDDQHPDLKQTPLVRAALEGLPGELGVRHRDLFASQLFSQLRSVKPSIKFRYLREGFAVVGDHKLAADARKVFNYYQDLTAEIRLETELDGIGDGVVGHGRPFGVLVSLVHTPEIERESGGFGRFLQNQSSMQYGYNYGRPAVDYRDRFTAAMQESLKENFEVISTTFETDKVRSRESKEAGRRSTPYAYLLLKARGPHVDRLPPLKIDLDFLDTSGYVVLPVESPALPLDARPAQSSPRPVEKLVVTQVLDERQAEDGKLLLEVRATARGLVPELAELVRLEFPGFTVGRTEDRALSVAKFDEESLRPAIVSERSWVVGLDAAGGRIAPDTPFTFAAAVLPATEMNRQRYRDADLETVGPEVTLEAGYGRRQIPWPWLVAGLFVLAVTLAGGLAFVRRGRRPAPATALGLPEPLTPFSLIDWLRELQATHAWAEPKRGELRDAIALIEHHYFAESSNGRVDLRQVAEQWAREVPANRQPSMAGR